MSVVVGIDFSTIAIDVVTLDEDTDRAEHHRRRLDTGPGDALQRIRRIRDAMPARGTWTDRGAVVVGIELPYGRAGSDRMAYALGAIIASIDEELPLELLRSDDWRRRCSLPIRGKGATPAAKSLYLKQASVEFASKHWKVGLPPILTDHAADAFGIAYATRQIWLEERIAA